MRTYNQTPKNIEDQIVQAYISGLSSVIISKQFNVHPSTILEIVRRNNHHTRTTKETSKRYHFNERFFEKIDSQEKAYWIGFILADGCISRGKDLIIALKKEDESHLQKFITTIDGNNHIQTRILSIQNRITKYSCARLAIRSENMVKDLMRHGITERKSLTANLPKIIPSTFLNHFWRGVVDGDGHICEVVSINGKYKYVNLEVGLCGSKAVVEGFETYVKKYVNTAAKTRPDKRIWRFSVGGNKSVQLCSLLYHEAMIYLDRKMLIYRNYNKHE